jgi:hypothetical protein
LYETVIPKYCQSNASPLQRTQLVKKKHTLETERSQSNHPMRSIEILTFINLNRFDIVTNP